MDVATRVDLLLRHTPKSDQLIGACFSAGLIGLAKQGVEKKVLNDKEEKCANGDPEGKVDPIPQPQENDSSDHPSGNLKE